MTLKKIGFVGSKSVYFYPDTDPYPAPLRSGEMIRIRIRNTDGAITLGGPTGRIWCGTWPGWGTAAASACWSIPHQAQASTQIFLLINWWMNNEWIKICLKGCRAEVHPPPPQEAVGAVLEKSVCTQYVY